MLQVVDWLNFGRTPTELPRAAVALNPTISFEGIKQTNLVPPSPDIAVGPNDVLLTVHSALARYPKSGTDPKAPQTTLQDWFASILPAVCPDGPQNCNMFDPSVKYDSLHGRFLVLAFSENARTRKTYFVLSVSNGATYDSGWKNWALEGSLNGTAQTPLEVDFPQLGYDNNAVYLTANMFDSLSNPKYAKVRILKKSELYNPTTQALTFRDIADLSNGDLTKASTLKPVQLRGTPGISSAPGIMINASLTPNANYLTLWQIQDPTGTSPTAVSTTLTGVLPYDLPSAFRSLGSAQPSSAGDTAILRAVSRNGVIYTARNTGYADVPTTVTYDRIDLATKRVTTQARLLGGSFFFPAFDLPASHGPDNSIPTKTITGSATDLTGSLTYIGIPGVKAGEDAYTSTNGRWGDYFGGAVDPVSGGLWVYGEYAKPKLNGVGQWGTWVAHFPWNTTQQFTDVTPSSAFYDYVNVLKQWSITAGCTDTTYCPLNNVTRGQMAVFVVRAMLGDTFTFPAAPYFTDVPATNPFFKYIQKLRELGVTSGCTPTTFCPGNNVTRGEMAVFLIRGKLSGLLKDDFAFPQTGFFTDVPAAHPYFKFVQKMRELGITSGCGTATNFCVDSPVSRDQMAVFIARGFLN